MQQFVALPARLPRSAGHRRLDLVKREELDPRKNPISPMPLLHSGSQPTASRWGDPAQIDRLEAGLRPGLGHFGLLAAIDDDAVVEALCRRAEEWLASQGVSHVTGPFGLSINQESGLLLHGHEQQPMFLMPWDGPWLPQRLETQGYRPARDLFAYRHDVLDEPQHKGRRLLERIGRDPSVKARFADLRRIDTEIAVIATVFNDAWADNWGFVPLTLEEVAHMAKELRPFITNESMTVIEVDGTAEAFAFALPNLLELSDGLDGLAPRLGLRPTCHPHPPDPQRAAGADGVGRRYATTARGGARLSHREAVRGIAQARHHRAEPCARYQPPHAQHARGRRRPPVQDHWSMYSGPPSGSAVTVLSLFPSARSTLRKLIARREVLPVDAHFARARGRASASLGAA